MTRSLIVSLIVAALSLNVAAARPYVLVLGIGQDAGVPQMGCDSPFCRLAWNDPSRREMVSSIALVDPDSRGTWIFDATPDLPEQFELLRNKTRDRSIRIDGIFLTHAHIGHYTGLMYLGRESMNTKAVPVYSMPRMEQMLRTNAPWSQLVELNNIDIRGLSDRVSIRLTSDLSVTPFAVPHRDEFSETVGYTIRTKSRSVMYIPDIDKWDRWKTGLADALKLVDYALIDGTFYQDGEISRPMSEVPHPFVVETIDLLRQLPLRERQKVYFTHFNHSNPIVQRKKGPLTHFRKAGFRVARTGLRLLL